MGGICDFDILTSKLVQQVSEETDLSATPHLWQMFTVERFRFDELLADQRWDVLGVCAETFRGDQTAASVCCCADKVRLSEWCPRDCVDGGSSL